jgi:Holliday junction resolvase RusA-like endonuclease
LAFAKLKFPGMEAMISFRVFGKPIPQPRPRFARIGQFSRAYVPKSHPIHDFREAVRLGAMAAGVTPAAGLVEVSVVAMVERPPSHFLKSGGLAKSAPAYPGRAIGDADNIAKGVLDALKGLAFADDAQADLGFVRRRYGPQSFVDVWIVPVSEPKGEQCSSHPAGGN